MKTDKYKFSSYQIMIMEKAAKPGHWIKPSAYYDHQQVLDNKGNNIQRFKRPTFLALLKIGAFEADMRKRGFPVRVGRRYRVNPKITKLLMRMPRNRRD